MRNRRVMVLFLMLAFVCTAGMAEADGGYALTYQEGVMFDVYFLENGDIVHYGSYGGRPAADDGAVISTVARQSADGAEIWSLDLPTYDAYGASQVLPLSDGQFLATTVQKEGEATLFFLDADRGVTRQETIACVNPVFFAVDGGVILAEPMKDADGFRMTWLDLDGKPQLAREYPLEVPDALHLSLIETQDGFYCFAQYTVPAEKTGGVVMKIAKDGLLQWKRDIESPAGSTHIFQPDGSGGVIAMGVGSIRAYGWGPDDWEYESYTMERIGPDGEQIWEKEIDVRERGMGRNLIRWDSATDEGVLTVWETDDTLWFVTIHPDGTLAEGPAYQKEEANAGTGYSIAGYSADSGGDIWVYYHAASPEDGSDVHHLTPHLRSLDEFSPAPPTRN